ncbi:MAG: hypothetical protein DI618_02305, partial [Dermacoccus nishinomiyaensis]
MSPPPGTISLETRHLAASGEGESNGPQQQRFRRRESRDRGTRREKSRPGRERTGRVQHPGGDVRGSRRRRVQAVPRPPADPDDRRRRRHRGRAVPR